MQRFEYRIETIAFTPGRAGADQLVTMLNTWGKQGWRLRHFVFDSRLQTDHIQIVLERRLDHWLLSEDDD